LPQIPQVSDKADLTDKIRTILPAPLQDWKKAVLAQFNTVLAFKKPGFTPFSDPLNPLKGMYSNFLCYGSPDHDTFKIDLIVAQVWVIFKLPPEYRHFDTPLAYIEWYTPLQLYSPSLGMYQITHSFRNRYRHTFIIPVDQIVWSCHLIPKFGNKVGHTWNAKSVLDSIDTYYLNPNLCL
jgi:hypothetical protein